VIWGLRIPGPGWAAEIAAAIPAAGSTVITDAGHQVNVDGRGKLTTRSPFLRERAPAEYACAFKRRREDSEERR
jgi:hypothetical protein